MKVEWTVVYQELSAGYLNCANTNASKSKQQTALLVTTLDLVSELPVDVIVSRRSAACNDFESVKIAITGLPQLHGVLVKC